LVPCRHEHGGGEARAHFDHVIYSLNTTQSCGSTPEEAKAQIEAKGWLAIEPGTSVEQVLGEASPLHGIMYLQGTGRHLGGPVSTKEVGRNNG
jgi:hypothetical protein